jgi:hypothetical protein
MFFTFSLPPAPRSPRSLPPHLSHRVSRRTRPLPRRRL